MSVFVCELGSGSILPDHIPSFSVYTLPPYATLTEEQWAGWGSGLRYLAGDPIGLPPDAQVRPRYWTEWFSTQWILREYNRLFKKKVPIRSTGFNELLTGLILVSAAYGWTHYDSTGSPEYLLLFFRFNKERATAEATPVQRVPPSPALPEFTPRDPPQGPGRFV